MWKRASKKSIKVYLVLVNFVPMFNLVHRTTNHFPHLFACWLASVALVAYNITIIVLQSLYQYFGSKRGAGARTSNLVEVCIKKDINVLGDGARAPVLLAISHSTRQAFEKGGGLPSPSK